MKYSLKTERVKNLKLLLGFNETRDQSAMATSACWYGYTLMREDGHVLGKALELEVEEEWRKGRQ